MVIIDKIKVFFCCIQAHYMLILLSDNFYQNLYIFRKLCYIDYEKKIQLTLRGAL